MANFNDAEHGAGTGAYESRLQEQAGHLRRLKVERGDPSLDRIDRRAREIGNGAALPKGTLSAIFSGTRHPPVDKLILLVRTLMSWDTDSENIPAPDRRDPVLNEWRERWQATTALRARRPRATAQLHTPVGTGEPKAPSPTPEPTATPRPLPNGEISAQPSSTDASTARARPVSRSFGPVRMPQSEPGVRAASEQSLGQRAVRHALEAGKPMLLPPLAMKASISLSFSPDDSLLVAGSSDGTVRCWNPLTGDPVGRPIPVHNKTVWSVAYSPDNACFAFASDDSTVWVWDPATGSPVGRPLTGHSGAVYAVAFSSDSALLATGGKDGTVRLWNPATGNPVGEPLTGHDDSVWAVSFSLDGALLASGGSDGIVRLWNPATGKPVGEPLTGHSGAVFTVAFSSDSALLATGGKDGTVRLWNPATGNPTSLPLPGHNDRVWSVAFSPNGALLASGGGDGIVRLWDSATGSLLWDSASGEPVEDSEPVYPFGEPYVAFGAWLRGVAFSSDGSLLAATDADAVRLWVLPSPVQEHSLRC
ncbi:PQQ-binding-like beta-propeller repeat protein [Streptomyces sp. NPDC005356]|uniref:WD40 repeat domain-containing protein n=1 Tax=Streptomyces sp. NPDC005356 TaxID=3157167 RepID=UPI0033A36120